MSCIFWISIFLLVYTYAGYPVLLMTLIRFKSSAPGSSPDNDVQPTVSMIIPVHNEEDVIRDKIRNVLDLDYPVDRLEVLFISDGSTDNTVKIVMEYETSGLTCHAIPSRSGKASALNLGLKSAKNGIIVFSDASIMLNKDALVRIVQPFVDPEIGSVSGEDHIGDSSGEGLYGRYELFLRRLESKLGSIVGASGSFYAQRKELCDPFVEGMAPDFLSVLNCVERGSRAISESSAIGRMRSLSSQADEYGRKVRTFLRGMTTLHKKRALLNPFKYGFFALELWSHKVLRWMVPLFLIFLYVSNLFLIPSPLFTLFLAGQSTFYLFALLPMMQAFPLRDKLIFKVPRYFCTVNMAILHAELKFISGTRQEIWDPSRRAP